MCLLEDVALGRPVDGSRVHCAFAVSVKVVVVDLQKSSSHSKALLRRIACFTAPANN
jgi:hypothetical protein